MTYQRRLALFYGALFLVYGVHLPYLPVWLEWRGLSAAEIGIVTAAPFFLRVLVTPAAGALADRMGNHRVLVVWLSLLALGSSLALARMEGFWPILAAALALSLATTTIMPLTETIAVAGVRASGLDYGRMRLWGSLSFILASFGGGALVDASGAGIGAWLIVAGCLATLLAASALPAPVPPRQVTRAAAREALLGMRALAVGLLARPELALFLVAVGAVQGAHALFYAFGAVHWRGLGISGTWIGVLWTIGVLAEVAVFAYSRAILARVGPVELLIAAALAAMLRWSVMSLDPGLALLVPLQLLHALTYGAAHVGAIRFIERAIPERASGTMQALYATVAAGVVMGAATLASGAIYERYAGQAYLAMALLASVGLVAALALRRRWSGQEVGLGSQAA